MMSSEIFAALCVMQEAKVRVHMERMRPERRQRALAKLCHAQVYLLSHAAAGSKSGVSVADPARPPRRGKL